MVSSEGEYVEFLEGIDTVANQDNVEKQLK